MPFCYGSAIPKELYDYPDDPSATLQQLQQTQRVIARLLPKANDPMVTATDDSPAPLFSVTELTDKTSHEIEDPTAVFGGPPPTPTEMQAIPTVMTPAIDKHSSDVCEPPLMPSSSFNQAVLPAPIDATAIPVSATNVMSLEITTNASSTSLQEPFPSNGLEYAVSSAFISSTVTSSTVLSTLTEGVELTASSQSNQRQPDLASSATTASAALTAPAAAEVNSVEIVFYLGSAASAGAARPIRKRKHPIGQKTLGKISHSAFLKNSSLHSMYYLFTLIGENEKEE